MHVAILGATGGTGASFVQQALAANLTVTAIARRPDAVPQAPGLTTLPGDVRDEASLRRAFAAMSPAPDVLVCVVGAKSLWEARRSTDLCTTMARHLGRVVPAGTAIVAVSSGGVEPQPHDGFFYKAILKPLFLEPLYVDLRGMEAVLRAGPHPWTIVRAPYLTGTALTQTYETSREGPLPHDGNLTRPDLAHFLLTISQEPTRWANTTVWISS